MKLIHCTECQDIYNVTQDIKRCSCGKTVAFHVNYENIFYGGESAVCLGIDNNALVLAEHIRVLDGFAPRFDSYVTALWCESTIKIRKMETMTDLEICAFYGRTMPAKTRWNRKIYKKRNGLRRHLYLFCKKLMKIELSKEDSAYMTPQDELWYNDFSHRVLQIAKKLSSVSKQSSPERWFKILFSIFLDTPGLFKKWEKIKDSDELYMEVYEEYYKDELEDYYKDKSNNIDNKKKTKGDKVDRTRKNKSK